MQIGVDTMMDDTFLIRWRIGDRIYFVDDVTPEDKINWLIHLHSMKQIKDVQCHTNITVKNFERQTGIILNK